MELKKWLKCQQQVEEKRNKGSEIILGKTIRKRRNGTGPFKGSYQRQKSKIGRRKKAGLLCPKKK